MGRKSLKSLPIVGFETIGERCKGDRRISKRPQTYESQVFYTPKYLIKSQPQMYDHFHSQQSINGNDIDFKVNQSIGRKKFVKKRKQKSIKKENDSSIDQTIERVVENERNYYSENSFEMHSSPDFSRNDRFDEFYDVSTSTPKPIKKRDNYCDSSISSKQTIDEMPPKLFPVVENDDEYEDINRDLSSPPILYEKTVFYNNSRDNSIENLIEAKREELFQLNHKNHLNIESRNNGLDYNFEIENLNKQLIESKLEINLLRNQLISLNKQLIISKNENSKLKQKVIESKLRFDSEINELKKTHWCVFCMSEASYYCCWTGTYCSTNCQSNHWKNGHKNDCTRLKQ